VNAVQGQLSGRKRFPKKIDSSEAVKIVPGKNGKVYDRVTCFGCQAKGHFKDQCPEGTMSSFKLSVDKYSYFFAFVGDSGRSEVMVDSGAAVSLVSPDVSFLREIHVFYSFLHREDIAQKSGLPLNSVLPVNNVSNEGKSEQIDAIIVQSFKTVLEHVDDHLNVIAQNRNLI